MPFIDKEEKELFVLSCIAAIELLLRRTLVRSVILLYKFSQITQIDYCFYSVFICAFCELTCYCRNISHLS